MTTLGSKTAINSSQTPPRLMTRKRWVIIWLAFIGLSINYLDRSSLSVALPFMGKDFELTATQPATFWNTLAPHEYDFQANVNPAVPHPRWSQTTERLLAMAHARPSSF